MRITTLMAQQRRQSELLSSQSRLEIAQQQVSTGRRILRPSDDAAGTSELLQLNTRLAERQQQSASMKRALPVMQATDSALGDISGNLQSAQNAALRGANTATMSQSDREALAAQIDSAAQAIRAKLNTSVDQRYIFAGTANDTAPFVAGTTTTYVGNKTPMTLDIAEGQPFDMSITGDQIVGGTQGGGDLFANLTSLSQAIRAGNSAAIQTSMTQVKSDFDRVVRLRGDIGARLNYVDMAQNSVEQEVISIQSRQSVLQDADLSEAIVAEKIAETSQQATLAMAGRLGSLSLLDYLR